MTPQHAVHITLPGTPPGARPVLIGPFTLETVAHVWANTLRKRCPQGAEVRVTTTIEACTHNPETISAMNVAQIAGAMAAFPLGAFPALLDLLECAHGTSHARALWSYACEHPQLVSLGQPYAPGQPPAATRPDIPEHGAAGSLASPAVLGLPGGALPLCGPGMPAPAGVDRTAEYSLAWLELGVSPAGEPVRLAAADANWLEALASAALGAARRLQIAHGAQV